MDDTQGGARNPGDRSGDVTERVEADVADGQSPAQAVVGVVAEHTGDEPFEMEPLNDVVDTDALDALFGPLRSGTSRRGGAVEFDYHGCRVTLRSDGGVVVRGHGRR